MVDKEAESRPKYRARQQWFAGPKYHVITHALDNKGVQHVVFRRISDCDEEIWVIPLREFDENFEPVPHRNSLLGRTQANG